MSYERRRNALVRLGAPPCERCRRPAPQRQMVAAPKRFMPNVKALQLNNASGPKDAQGDPIVVAMCCHFCRSQVEQARQMERDDRRRQMQYEQQQHEIRMYQIRMERARANPEYVRGCIQMQHELKDILDHY